MAAKSDTSRSEIEAAIEALVAKGVEPSVRKIYDLLGRGSFSTILNVLSAWRKARVSQATPDSHMPEALTESALNFATLLWRAAEKKANDTAQDTRRGADQRTASLEQQVAELTEALEQAEHENVRLIDAQEHEQKSLAAAHGEIAASAREIEILKKVIADMSGPQSDVSRARNAKKAYSRPNGATAS
jgi:hypothetical protein